jgi:hypothetical protein
MGQKSAHLIVMVHHGFHVHSKAADLQRALAILLVKEAWQAKVQ